MELALLSITSVSLLLALGMGAVLWSVLRDAQARSEARVALLKEAAGEMPECTDDVPAVVSEVAPAPDSRIPVTGEGMFSSGLTVSPPFRAGTALVLAVAFCGTAAVLLALQLVEAPATVPPLAAAAEARPLELLMLAHTPDQDGLTISGIARNPQGSPRRTGVMVVASALDASGREVGWSRSALEDSVLEPGGESPFVINVAVASAPSRYRVGFRGTDGRVIAHVDRRSDDISRNSTTGGGPWVR